MSVAVCGTPEFGGHKPERTYPLSFVRRLASLVFLLLAAALFEGYALADEILPKNISNNGKSEFVAPVDSFSANDQTLHMFGYNIRITAKTKYEDFDRSAIPPFPLETGQWLKVKAHKRSDGVLLADKIRKVKQRPLYISILEDDAERKIFTGKKEKNQFRNPLEVFLEDENKGVAFNFRPSKNLLLGGKFEQDAKLEFERDLDINKKRNRNSYTSTLWLAALWKYSGNSFVLIEPATQYYTSKSQDSSWQNKSSLKLVRAYTFINVFDFLSLNLGRQDYIDERKWLYDDILDAARIYLFAGRLQGEVSVSTGRKFLDQQNDTQNINNITADIRYYLDRHDFLSAWYVSRDDKTTENFSPKLFGIRSIANPRKGWQHWFELARASGEAGNEHIDGYAIDVGFSYIIKTKPRPYLIAGLAYGSGRNSVTSQAGAFRQSGLQDNSDKFGGLTSYHYYGEVFDPELSNKIISTLGMGARLTPNFSVDLLTHTYQQAVASQDLGVTRIKADPQGTSTDLGSEIDLILGYRKRDIKSELVMGRFEPGAAFKKQNASHLVSFQFAYKF